MNWYKIAEEQEDKMSPAVRIIYDIAIKKPENKRKPFEKLLIKRIKELGYLD